MADRRSLARRSPSRRPGTYGATRAGRARRREGFTITFHAQRTRLPHIMFEIRQDEIDDADGVARYARILADCLKPPLEDQGLYSLFDGDNLPTTGGLRAWRHAGHISPLE